MLGLGRLLPPARSTLDPLHKAYPELFPGKLRCVRRQSRAKAAFDGPDLPIRYLKSDYYSVVCDIAC